METIEFKSIPSDRMEKIKELCNVLSAEDFKIEAEEMSDLHGIRMDVYGKNPLFALSPTRQFYQLVPVPIASVALHDESCGNEELLFETSIYRDLGKILFSTGWQAIPEVVAMLYAASGRENEEQENNA